MQAFFKIVLPEAATGIAATAVFAFSPHGMNMPLR
jgi:ABC-type glycerol-3-phosphate transport system permease component